jgi:hypothetical protein
LPRASPLRPFPLPRPSGALSWSGISGLSPTLKVDS